MSTLKLKPYIPTEHEIQTAFFNRVRARIYSDSRFALVFAIPNGSGVAHQTRTKRDGTTVRYSLEGQKLREEGLTAGVPDVFCAISRPSSASIHYFGYFIEFKRPGEKPTREQLDYAYHLEEQGYRYDWFDNDEQAWKSLCKYLGVKP